MPVYTQLSELEPFVSFFVSSSFAASCVCLIFHRERLRAAHERVSWKPLEIEDGADRAIPPVLDPLAAREPWGMNSQAGGAGNKELQPRNSGTTVTWNW
jgi:hypothetical protein